MNDDEYAFLDSNVLIYTVSNDIVKKQRAIELLSQKNVVISTQIISESINVMYRKLNYDYSQIRRITNKFVEKTILYPIIHNTIRRALNIAEIYGYAYRCSDKSFRCRDKACLVVTNQFVN